MVDSFSEDLSSARVDAHDTDGREAATGAASPDEDKAIPPAVLAEGIAIVGAEGPVYGPVDVTIPGQGLTMLSGRGGSGRTALALTISGRMKPDSGSLSVLGKTNVHDIRNAVAIAGVEDIDLLDRDVKVKTVITEHKAWSSPWISWIKPADQEYYENLCRPVFGERDLPPLDAYVSQISGLDRILIRLALSLNPASKTEIGFLVMDDLEQVHEFEDRLVLLYRLGELAQKIPVVVNSVNPIPADLAPEYTLIELFTDASHLQPSKPGVAHHLFRAREL